MKIKLAFFLLFLMFAAFSTEIENDEILLESMQPKDEKKLKQTPNLFPREIMSHDLEANEVLGKDPNNLIPTENKKEIRFFLQNKGKESANRLFDSFYDLDVSQEAFPFVAKLLLQLSEYVEVERTSLLNRTPLTLATYFDSEEAVSRLIKRGANTEAIDENGWTALHFASWFERLPSCRVLLEKKAKVNARTKHGRTTSLMLATRKNSVELVQILLAFDANPHMKDADNETALDFAPQNCADAIRAHIIKVDAIDTEGCSSLHRAAKFGNVIHCKLLLLQGANVNHQDIYGVTPLMVAAVNGCCEVVKAFLQFDADTRILDEKGNTAHKMATPSCAYFIAEHEAKLN